MSNIAGIYSVLPIAIGNVTLPSPVFLAPMSGITDAPFRRMAARLGQALWCLK